MEKFDILRTIYAIWMYFYIIMVLIMVLIIKNQKILFFLGLFTIIFMILIIYISTKITITEIKKGVFDFKLHYSRTLIGRTFIERIKSYQKDNYTYSKATMGSHNTYFNDITLFLPSIRDYYMINSIIDHEEMIDIISYIIWHEYMHKEIELSTETVLGQGKHHYIINKMLEPTIEYEH